MRNITFCSAVSVMPSLLNGDQDTAKQTCWILIIVGWGGRGGSDFCTTQQMKDGVGEEERSSGSKVFKIDKQPGSAGSVDERPSGSHCNRGGIYTQPDV